MVDIVVAPNGVVIDQASAVSFPNGTVQYSGGIVAINQADCIAVNGVPTLPGGFIPFSSHRWNGSAYVVVLASSDLDAKYRGIGKPSKTNIFTAFTAVLSASDYAEFRAHGMYDALSNATTVDFDDPSGLAKIKTELAALVSDTSITQEQIDTTLAALKPASAEG